MNSFKANEPKKDYQKASDKLSIFEIEDKKYMYVREILISFETNDKKVNYSSKLGFNGNKFPVAYNQENIYSMLHRKYIPIEEYEKSTQKDEFEYFYEKDDELKGDKFTDENEGNIEYGNNFINCKIFDSKQ